MKQSMIFGVFLLLVSLILAILLSVKLPFVKTNTFPVPSPVEVPPDGDPYNFYNVTLTPLGKEDYHVEVTITPYYMVDFWAVNETGFYALANLIGLGDVFRAEYPDKYPFSLITAYAKEINVTHQKWFELSNLTSNGTYCLVLINFFENPQMVAVNVEERYLEPPRTLLEPNLASRTIAVMIFVIGACLVIISRKRPARRAKRHVL
jgi:hypothetical protein